MKNNSLQEILTHLSKHNYIPCVGVEIEFYANNKIELPYSITEEKGKHQYEIEIPHTTDILNLCQTITEIVQLLKDQGAIIDPKPFVNDYGNAMHFHISLADDLIIEKAAQGLCHYMLDTFYVFGYSDQQYKRFDSKFMAPTHICFGGNNRTVAVRIPDKIPKRLEHRLSNPLVNPHLALFTILKSIYLGLTTDLELNKYQKIYGNAFDKQYNLNPFPTSKKEAFKLLNKKFFDL